LIDRGCGQFGISNRDLIASIPDELTKPETPARKYERITGKKYYEMVIIQTEDGESIFEHRVTKDAQAWLEAGQPDTWKGE